MCFECEKLTIKMPSILSEDRTGLVKVGDNSSMRDRKAVEKIATFFQREMEYDFIQYDASEPSGGTHEPYIPTIAYLFTNPDLLHYTKNRKSKILTIGGCCFRKRDHENISDLIWELDWIWLHPYERNKGVLVKYWKHFLREFKIFFPSQPISKSMEKFLTKQNHPIDAKVHFNLKN